MRLQRTIKRDIRFDGKGLHTGRDVTMRLKPAPRDTGVVFHRTDKGVFINATIAGVSDTAFATTLRSNGARISTVEHVLAAAYGLGVDNLLVEVNGPEVPILDGSSLGFVDRILETGMAKQASNRPYIRITRPVAFAEGNAEIVVLPHDGRLIDYQVQFDHPMLGLQKMTIELDRESFIHELAPARTFGFLRDVEYLRSQGLARGGSLDNAIIIGDKGVLNASGLRFTDELIRHKILDFLGDISLGGFPIHGHFIVSRSGHTTNTRFLKHLLASTGCWHMVTEVEEPLKATA